MTQDIHFVTLGLGREIFAVPTRCVTEIVATQELYRVPDAPAYLAGLADIREQAVPVIDLRSRLGLATVEATHQTRILVLEVAVRNEALIIGLMADRVIEVVTFNAEQIGPPPEIGAAWGSSYIKGIARHGESFVIVLNMASLFSGDVIAHLPIGQGQAMAPTRAA